MLPVSLVVDDYDEDWTRLRYVIVEGRADVLTGGPTFAQAVDLLVATYPEYRTPHLSSESGTIIRIAPTRILHWPWA